MHEIDPLLKKTAAALKNGSASSVTEAGRKTPVAGSKPASGLFDADRIDAINQVFSEFAFAYHNQFHKAFPDQPSVNIGKEYWLSCLAEFTPAQITRAARRLVKSSEYLPSLSALVKACESGLELFGLPAPRQAYIEACQAPSPKAAYSWSHEAVYHAGRASDWFILANEPESVAFPIFDYNYRQICQRVMQGEDFTIEPPKAIGSDRTRKLSPAERQERMRKLRQELDI